MAGTNWDHQGRIVKATGGFYYVDTEAGEVSCRARGLFRHGKEKTTPLVGDMVGIQMGEDGTGTVAEILPRKNQLVRPPLANLDHMVVVVSLTDPVPNLVVLDKYLAILEYSDIPAILVLTKPDLGDGEKLEEVYRTAGYPVYVVCNVTGEGAEAVKQAIQGTISAFSGNSGVGKSSLLNAIDPRFEAPVGDTSKKLGRGRHTTRHVELFPLPGGGLVADTPGFSSLDLEAMSSIQREELAGCFREFGPWLEKCRFRDCMHLREKDCAVRTAAESGKLPPSRYKSYQTLMEEIKDVKPWEQK